MKPPADLQEFILQLEEANQLARVTCEVDPYLEAAAVVNKVCKTPGGGKALLFENVKGASMPLAANLFGSMRRMALCFGAKSIDALAHKVEQELSAYKGVTSENALRQMVQKAVALTSPNREVPQSNDYTECPLSELPAVQSWPGDGGQYLTLAQVFTSMPDSKRQNCGMYRVQLVDDGKALLRCYPGSGGDKHLKAWHDHGEPMPVAVVLGGPPVLTWAAGVSLPDDIEEPDFASWLTDSSVPMIRGPVSGIKVPSAAEIIIEGFVYPGEELPEGPFGNHTGLYSEISPAPVIRISSVSFKKEAVYPCTVVGPPPMENVCLALATQKLLLPLVKHDCPWIEHIHLPLESIYHRIAFVQLTPDCNLTVEEIEESLKRTLLLKDCKFLVLVDSHAEISNLNSVYWNIVNMGDFSRFSEGVIDARTPCGKDRVFQVKSVVKLVTEKWEDYDL